MPCLEQTITDDLKLIERFAESIASTTENDWLVFKSPKGVEFAYRLLDQESAGFEARIAAVGPATATRCLELLGRCDLQPPDDQARGETLGRLLASEPPARALLAVARHGRRDVADSLRTAGWQVERFGLYETRPAIDAANDSLDLEVDAIFFASPSAVEGLFLQAVVGDVPLFAIGPTTARALEDAGRLTAGVADSPRLESLIELTFQTLPIPAEIAS